MTIGPTRSLRDVIRMVSTDKGDLVSVSCCADLTWLCSNVVLIHSPGGGLEPAHFLNLLKGLGGYWCALLR